MKLPSPSLYSFADQEGPSDPSVYGSSPIWRCEQSGMYIVESYTLVKEVLNRPALFSSKVSLALMDPKFPAAEAAAIFAEGGCAWARTLQTNDAPDHKRFRSLVDKVFTTRRVDQLEPGIRVTLQSMLASVSPNQVFDAVESLAMPFPLRIISEQLGVAPDHFRDFKRWSDAAVRAIGLGATREQHLAAARCAVAFQQYFIPILADGTRRPRGALVALVADADAGAEQPFTTSEKLSLLHQLMIAGHETTASTLATLLRLLAEDASLLARLRGAPLLRRQLIESVLRLHAPVQGLFRVTTAAASLGGLMLPPRSLLGLRLGSANRDPARFSDSELLSESTKTIAHLSFGFGMHHCVGATLARRELEVALEVICDTFSHLRLAVPPDNLVYTHSVMTRSLTALPLIGVFHGA